MKLRDRRRRCQAGHAKDMDCCYRQWFCDGHSTFRRAENSISSSTTLLHIDATSKQINHMDYFSFIIWTIVIQIKNPAEAGFHFALITRQILARQPAAIHRDGVAIDVVRSAGGQEDHRPHQVVGRPASRRDYGRGSAAALFVGAAAGYCWSPYSPAPALTLMPCFAHRSPADGPPITALLTP